MRRPAGRSFHTGSCLVNDSAAGAGAATRRFRPTHSLRTVRRFQRSCPGIGYQHAYRDRGRLPRAQPGGRRPRPAIGVDGAGRRLRAGSRRRQHPGTDQGTKGFCPHRRRRHTDLTRGLTDCRGRECALYRPVHGCRVPARCQLEQCHQPASLLQPGDGGNGGPADRGHGHQADRRFVPGRFLRSSRIPWSAGRTRPEKDDAGCHRFVSSQYLGGEDGSPGCERGRPQGRDSHRGVQTSRHVHLMGAVFRACMPYS